MGTVPSSIGGCPHFILRHTPHHCVISLNEGPFSGLESVVPPEYLRFFYIVVSAPTEARHFHRQLIELSAIQSGAKKQRFLMKRQQVQKKNSVF